MNKINFQFRFSLAIPQNNNSKSFLQFKSLMGIDGLLTLLKPLIKKQHISEFRNKTLGIDALPWIYKGIYGANIQMGESLHQNPNAFLYYIIEMIEMLKFYNIQPLFIFDGKSLPAKRKTLQKRKKTKQEQNKKAQQLKNSNQREKAAKTLARYINIDEAKLSLVMSLLKQKNIQFVIAPYQADSQISKLFGLGLIEAAITEDSDLVVYGVDVILKLKETGQCDFLSLRQDKEQILKFQCPFLNKFCIFNHQQRIETAILSGCDYVDSLKGIGIKKAIKLVQQNQGLEKIVQSLKNDPKMTYKVPQNYLNLVQNAKIIFLLAKTFNPRETKLEYLKEDFLNQILSSEKIEPEVLQEIVGISYDFGQKHYSGEINCKSQQKRTMQKVSLKEIYRLNGENMKIENFKGKQKHQKLKKEGKQVMIDETSSICWKCDLMNEGLLFLFQKQLVQQFFTGNFQGQLKNSKPGQRNSDQPQQEGK